MTLTPHLISSMAKLHSKKRDELEGKLPAPKSLAILIGQKGDYFPSRLLGEGGGGEVYMGLDGHGQEVAMKRPRNDRTILNAACIREAAALGDIKHPNVVAYLDKAKDPSQGSGPFLVTELLLGGSMEELGIVSWPDARSLMIEVLQGIQAIHDAGMIHGDFKTDAIRFSGTNAQPRITDLGLSLLIQEGMTPRRLQGTPEYLAPESATRWGATYLPQTDIYQSALVLCEMLSGELPFELPRRPAYQAEAWLGEVLSIHRTAAPKIRSIRNDVFIPPRAESLILRALEKDPSRRFHSAREMRDGLVAID